MSADLLSRKFEDPASVVSCFIQAMNQWETESWQAMRSCRTSQDPSSYQSDVKARMDAVFARFCTPRERKYGRNSSFQNPPEYDPRREKILGVEVDEGGKRASVTTNREAVLGGGRRKYTLIRRSAGWRIDTLRREICGEWKSAIL